MTREHNIVFSLGEIRHIVFECENCQARIVVSPDSLSTPPEKCPHGHPWEWNVSMNYRSTDSPFRALLSALALLRNSNTDRGMRILFEIASEDASESTTV